ncbi:MAG: lipid II flippase MurJ [Patescibacteria group bacterium]|nr:oligosaccharide flippase family protein [Patescibacteria group bacterium]
MLDYLFSNGKKFFTKEQPTILSASAIMMVLILISKIVGLLTKTIMVSQLGAEKYGIFVAANTIPETLSMLFIFGSITSVIIPVLVEEIEEKDLKSFSRLFSSIINVGLLAFVAISVFVLLLADDITPFVIEKIAKPVDPFTQEQIGMISDMMKWLLLPQVILGISSFLSSALNAYKRFVIPQLAPLFYNLGILFGAAVIIPLLGQSAWGITWGVLLGSVLHLLIQLPLGSHLKIKYKFTIDLASKRLREAFTISFPRIFSLAADQIALAIDRVLAIGLGATPLGAYQLAVSLVSMPFSLFSHTFSVAALPFLSGMYAKKDIKGFVTMFSKVFNQILFLTVPVTMIFLVLRLPLVRLLYGLMGNEFSWENTLMVAWVVFFFSLGLIPEVMLVFLNRVFFAMHDTVRPLLVGIFTVVGGIVTGLLFTNYFSHFDDFSLRIIYWNPEFFKSKVDGISAIGGLALSSSIIYSTSFGLLMILLRKKIGSLGGLRFWGAIIKKIMFGLVMAVFMYVLFKMWDEVLDTARTINVLILTSSTMVSGSCLYLWLAYIFKDPEVGMITKLISVVRRNFSK